MEDTCGCSPQANLTASPVAAVCPTNQKPGQVVAALTLRALLARTLMGVRPVEYRFCREPDCPTVYYSADGQQVFAEADLREKVYQKHTDDDEAPVCYCFRHTVGSIRAEITETGRSTVVERIRAGIQAGACACDIRNPQGGCCLGNVRQLVALCERQNRHARPAPGT